MGDVEVPVDFNDDDDGIPPLPPFAPIPTLLHHTPPAETSVTPVASGGGYSGMALRAANLDSDDDFEEEDGNYWAL